MIYIAFGKESIMQIGALSYQPYIYNTNTISRSSLNKISAISDDLLSSKTDFSGLTEESAVNVNPLRKGETSNFMDVLQMQFQMGQQNAARLIKPVEDSEEQEPVQNMVTSQNQNTMQRAIQAYQANMIA
jgi:hypothetical protein